MILLLALVLQVDPALPRYVPEGEVRGALTAIGSDTLMNLLTLWSEAIVKHHPGLRPQIEGKG